MKVQRLSRLPLPAAWASIACVCFCLGSWAAVASGSELRETPIVKAVEAARPSVVNIRGEKTVPATAAKGGRSEGAARVNGMGTGVVVDPRGYILTNHHVVDGVKEIQVALADGQRFIARLVARDPETDLAIIKIDAPESLPVITIGTSSDLMVAESVVALGNAYGYEHTATRGIISALHRAVQVTDAQFYEDLIQTDASINPGNSGGPLLNIDGQMIGVNVAVRAGAQGIGFAIPVDKAMAVAADLLASANVGSGWHGLTLAKEPCSSAGVAVVAVENDSPAALAGLQPGDVIAAIGGEPAQRALDFQRAVLGRGPGDQVELAVRRGESQLDLTLKLGTSPDNYRPNGDAVWQLLGLQLKPMPADEFKQSYQTRYRGGLTVVAVRPKGPADTQGIRPGDVVVGMHIWETISLENVNYIMNRPDFSTIAPLKFLLLRGNETFYGYLPVAMKTRETR